MKKVIIAEKPSVAREIAQIVGATEQRNGYMVGNDYAVTWAYGHLITLALPEVYGKIGFKKENLPIIPTEFVLTPKQVKASKGYKDDSGVVAQLNVIKKLFSTCESIIVATDAGREGELIFRYIYNYLNCKKTFQRLWISSLTDKAIREGLDNLKAGTDYNNLYLAAKARSEADWLVGINGTQAVTIAVGRGTYSIGRVQTPTLCMICSRYAENSGFTPQKFWRMTMSVDNNSDIIQFASTKQWFDEQSANDFYAKLKSIREVSISKIEKKEVSQVAPLLYDLTALQKDANRKYGFSADQTLSIAQKLYESKLITYPRTGSSYISEDVFAEIPKLIKSLRQHDFFGNYAAELKKLNNRCVNGKKVTDHHALLVTGITPKTMSSDETIIYDMIAGRMLESFSEKEIKDTTTITVVCMDEEFLLKGSIVKQSGWKSVWKEKDAEKEDTIIIPEWNEDSILSVKGYSQSQGTTKPKPLHTEATLLGAMETAGRELEDEVLREKMKDCGIGTPATRASIIETLLYREYIVRSKKSLVPTEKGMAIYSIVKPMRVANVEMTGEWEEAMAKIEQGEMNADTFKKSIEIYATQITTELLGSHILFPKSQSDVACPKCGDGTMQFFAKVVKCNNANCALPIFRQMAKKQLSDESITELINNGKSSIIKGFKSNAGNKFDAYIAFDDAYKVIFNFPPKKNRK